MNVGMLYGLARQAVSAWMDDYAPSMGAALAYYTMFSIAPLMLIAISGGGLAFRNGRLPRRSRGAVAGADG
jgi:membrane protein